MSYCSWCWGKRTQQLHLALTAKNTSARIPDSYEAKREAAKVARRKARKKTPRKCGFCRKPGHNAKTCTYKEDNPSSSTQGYALLIAARCLKRCA